MSRVTVENDQLVIAMKGARKFFALKGELCVPLENVAGATIGITWKDTPRLGDKRAGTDLDVFYYGGTFVQDGNKIFYDLKRREDAVVISLKDEEFERLIIGVEDPDATVALIEKALNNET